MIIFHELSNAFTKYWFGELVTPIGVGRGNDSRYGESGCVVEEGLLGGTLVVEWDDSGKFGDMNAIDRVLLLGKDSRAWELGRIISIRDELYLSPFEDSDTAEMVLSSLEEETFSRPVTKQLRQHVQSSRSVRARPTAIPTPEKREPPKIGLGFSNVNLTSGPVSSRVGCNRMAPEFAHMFSSVPM